MLTLHLGHTVFRWNEYAQRWTDCKGRFVSSPLTPEGEAKLFKRFRISRRRR